MNQFVLSGTNATLTVHDAGVTIKHSLTRREKTMAWNDIGGVTIAPGNWLTRPKLFILTKMEVAFANSSSKILQGAAGNEAAEWFVVVPMGQDKQFEAMKDEIIRRVTSLVMAAHGFAPLNPGDDVLVAWSDGQRYGANLRALHGKQALVAFPNGTEHWVEREYVSRS